MTDLGHEKRGMPRFPLQVPLAIKSGGTDPIEATTRDVSATGVFVWIGKDMREGEEIEFTMTLPQELTLTGAIQVACRGKIVRVQRSQADNRIGIAATIHSYEFLGSEQAQAASGF